MFIAFCHKNCDLFQFFFFFFCFLSALCVSLLLFIHFFYPFFLLCMMMAVASLIMSCTPSLIHWETLSQLHLLCSLSSSLIFSFLSHSRFCFPFLFLLHHLLSPLFDDGCRFISLWYLRGFRACDARGPRGQWAKPNLPNEVLIKLIMGN